MTRHNITRARFTKQPTPAQVRQGLALFALAKTYADEARQARQTQRDAIADEPQTNNHKQENGK